MQGYWNLETDRRGIAWLTIDVPGSKVNTLGSAVLSSLGEIIDDIDLDDRIRALVIISGKPDGFIAGADLDELESIDEPDRARELAEFGQSIFNKIANLKTLTIAAIHGACMGGGAELALACDCRVATDDPKTKIGLPEVNLGLIPGWGGTTRLPRLIGLAPAMDMILAGRQVSTRKARRIGLIDGTVAKAFMRDNVTAFVESILTAEGRENVAQKRRRAQSKALRLMASNPATRAIMFRKAEKTVLKKTHGHYPAPLKAIDIMRRTYGRSLEAGLRAEADAIAQLGTSETCRNLVRLFKITQRLKRSPDTGKRLGKVTHAAVLGAGPMGGGIAWALADAGINVRLKDINWDALQAGMAAAAEMFRAKVKRRRMTAGAMNVAMHRISCTTDNTGLARVDAVIEAVVENLEIKQKVLADLEQHVPRHALICTNTSSLRLDDLSKALTHQDRFVGLHFFNPVNRMQLVEVIAGPKTSADALARAVNLVLQMGKTPVVAGACAGFLVNRILVPYLTESARMFEEGVDADRIDHALLDFGMPMGPMKLADEVGLDVGAKVAGVLADAYGQRMDVPAILSELAKDPEALGKKTGRGIYIHNNGNTRPNPAVTEHELRTARHLNTPDSEIVDRAVLIMVNEAARCIEEGVVCDPEALDAAMVLGTGFAPFRGGVVRYAETRGIKQIVERLEELAEKHGPRFKPAPLLEKIAADGGRFPGPHRN